MHAGFHRLYKIENVKHKFYIEYMFNNNIFDMLGYINF